MKFDTIKILDCVLIVLISVFLFLLYREISSFTGFHNLILVGLVFLFLILLMVKFSFYFVPLVSNSNRYNADSIKIIIIISLTEAICVFVLDYLFKDSLMQFVSVFIFAIVLAIIIGFRRKF